MYNIKGRHQKEKPYTRTGDIIIAVNPFQWLQLYTEEIRQTYARHLIHNSHHTLDDLEPHVYEVSALAFKGLSRDQENQSILVSGESGAGKTETVKIAMRFLGTFLSNLVCMCVESMEDSFCLKCFIMSCVRSGYYGRRGNCCHQGEEGVGK